MMKEVSGRGLGAVGKVAVLVMSLKAIVRVQMMCYMSRCYMSI